jgi:hypothetical protein
MVNRIGARPNWTAMVPPPSGNNGNGRSGSSSRHPNGPPLGRPPRPSSSDRRDMSIARLLNPDTPFHPPAPPRPPAPTQASAPPRPPAPTGSPGQSASTSEAPQGSSDQDGPDAKKEKFLMRRREREQAIRDKEKLRVDNMSPEERQEHEKQKAENKQKKEENTPLAQQVDRLDRNAKRLREKRARLKEAAQRLAGTSGSAGQGGSSSSVQP